MVILALIGAYDASQTPLVLLAASASPRAESLI
jgi:hypothetical protein